MPKKISRKKQVLVLRENKNLLLAKIFPETVCVPDEAEAGKLKEILARLKQAFDAPDALWETMTIHRYEKTFPIISRIIAESFSFDDATAFFGFFEKPRRRARKPDR